MTTRFGINYNPTQVFAMAYDASVEMRHHQKAQALSMLASLLSCVPMYDGEACGVIDVMITDINACKLDLDGDYLGYVFRFVASKMHRYADNLRDEHTTIDTYR